MTTARRKVSKVGNLRMAAATIAVKPAAGPLTLNCDPLKEPMIIPPMMPAMMPLNNGAFEAKAIPRQSGSATKNTTIEDGKSAPNLFRYELTRLMIIGFRMNNRISLLKQLFNSKPVVNNNKTNYASGGGERSSG